MTEADIDRLRGIDADFWTEEERQALIEQPRKVFAFKRDIGLEPFWWAYNAIELEASLDTPGYSEMHYRLRCAIEELEKLLGVEVEGG